MKDLDKVLFFNQLALTYDSDLLVSDGVDLLKDSTNSKELLEFYDKLSSNLLMGYPLSESISSSCDYFDSREIKLIELGEKSGNISVVLTDMADALNNKIKIEEELKTALRYPSILGYLTLGILTLILVFIVPTYHDLIAKSGEEMTISLNTLNDLALFVKNYFVLLCFALILVIRLYDFWIKSPKGKKFHNKHSINSLLTKKIKIDSAVVIFTKNLAMLLNSGIDNLSAFEVLSEAESNEDVKKEIESALKILKSGGSFTEAMHSFSLFPRALNEMLSVAISSGHIVNALNKSHDLMLIQVEKDTEKMISTIEPLITVVITCVVGAVLILGVAPVFRILDGII